MAQPLIQVSDLRKEFRQGLFRKRVEAVVYAANVALRASDNPIQRHPHLSWLPERPWQGPPADTSHIRADLRGAFDGPGGTPIKNNMERS